MGGVALRFCLVLGRVLMVGYCCASGCFGCVCVVLELVPRVVRRCGSGYIGCRCIMDPSSPDAVWSLPWRWCRGAFEGGSPLRKRLHWMRCIWTHLLQMQSASESNVRQFSWVVWRCVFVWFWGVF